MSTKLVWGSDLYKGFKIPQNTALGKSIDDITPFQMMSLEDKTPEWIHAVADFYETSGWGNVEKKAGRIQKNFWMRQGLLDQSDYIVNPEINPFHQAVGMIVPPQSQSPLEQFYPLAPNFVDVLRGEYIKRDNTWTVQAIDPYSKNKSWQNKNEKFQQLILQAAMLSKQEAMARMGITEETDPKQYQQQLQAIQQQMAQVEFESRNFRTEGVKWAEKVLNIHEQRYNLSELEPDSFESMLISDRSFWHLDLLDDDFKIELLNPKWCDYYKAPGHKYVSDGDYFLWFDFLSCGDVVNKYGRRMKEEDLLKLKDIYVKTANIIVPDAYKGRQGAYYQYDKPWAEATDLNPAMNDALLGKELAYNFMRTPNFDHNQEVDILNPVWGRLTTGHPQMFRVMNLYWRSLRKIGWLTKINRDGTRPEPKWVDENYKVTEEPVYDLSVIKEKSKNNLLYGEHIDWTWGPEWRRVIKISPNQKHTFWLNSENQLAAIYIDGGPVKFQFKGANNPFDCLPPVEGCEFSYFNAGPHSFIDRIKPLQIIYNICMNKVPKKFLNDFGNKVAVHRALMKNDSIDGHTGEIDPREAFEDKLIDSPIFDFTYDRELLAGGIGQPPVPTVLQLSTIQEAQLYFSLGQQIKWEAGELIGITRQRVGGGKASETATANEQAVQYSETQTEKYFEQHSHLMQRVRQRMLDATQYYSTFNENNRDVYMTEEGEQFFLEITGMENTLPQYNIFLQSKANARAALQKIQNYLSNNNTLSIKPSSYIGAMVENSLPKLMNLVKQGEFEQDQQEQVQRDHELQIEQERRKTLQMQQQFELEKQDRAKNADYVRETDVAEIRAVGGIQTDVDANGNSDAMDNLNIIMKQQEINNQMSQHNNEINMDRLNQAEKNQTELQKAAMDLAGKKYAADKTLEVAKENRTAAEMKKKQAAKKTKKK
jgi:hypothetical protein